MRGSCSPSGMSTTLVPPKVVVVTTMPGCSRTHSPMIAAPPPNGCARIAANTSPACSRGTNATSFPSLATYSGSRPSIAQALATSAGTGIDRSFADLARAAFAALDREPAIEFIDMPEALRANYQYVTQADLSNLRAAGYSREMAPLEEGVRRYVQGYLLAADPYR